MSRSPLDILSLHRCRWRRRWQWGPGPSHPQATTSTLDTATAPVDIEQPAIHSQGATQNDAGASSSSSHGVLAGNAPAAALGSTHFNFPGMHYSRSSASRLSAAVCHMICVTSQVVLLWCMPFTVGNAHVLHSLLDMSSCSVPPHCSRGARPQTYGSIHATAGIAHIYTMLPCRQPVMTSFQQMTLRTYVPTTMLCRVQTAQLQCCHPSEHMLGDLEGRVPLRAFLAGHRHQIGQTLQMTWS